MFGLFQKPVGIQITDKAVMLAKVDTKTAIPSVLNAFKQTLPEKAVKSGVIIDEKAVLATLTALKKTVKENKCVVALPEDKCYNIVLTFPHETKDSDIKKTFEERADAKLPTPLSELYYETAIFRDLEKKRVLFFVAGIEKKVLDSYKKVLAEAKWDVSSFVLETIALSKAMPVDFTKFPTLMFVHSFGTTSLLCSVFHNITSDGTLTANLEIDFKSAYKIFTEEFNLPPGHIIVSGDTPSLAVLEKIPIREPKPEFVFNKFLVNYKGKQVSLNDFIVPIGLAVASKSIKGGSINLLKLL